MPELDPESDQHTAELLDPAVAGVLRRWNPDGVDLLHRVRTVDPRRRTVALFSPSRTDAAELRAELARLRPELDLVASPLEAVAVVALLDAGSVLGRSELDGIAELLAAGNQVVFALHGVEAHRDWRLVRDRDAAALHGFASGDRVFDPRIWPVSARLSIQSRALTDGGSNPDLVLAGSGLRQLHAAILAALSADLAVEPAVDRRLCRATATVLRQTADSICAAAGTLRGDDPATTALRTERMRLAARRDGGRAEVTATLRAQLQLARVDLLHGPEARAHAANTAVRAELDRLGPRRPAEFPHRLKDLVAELTVATDRDIHDRMAELAARIDPAGSGLPTGTAIIRTSAPQVDDSPAPRPHRATDRLPVLLGAVAAIGLARLAVLPLAPGPALDIATAAAALLLGAALGWCVMRARRRHTDRAQLRQWVADALVSVRAQLEQRVVAALVETESLLADHVVRTSAARMAETDRRIAEISAQVREMAAQRAARLAACERDLAVLTHGDEPDTTRIEIAMNTVRVDDGAGRIQAAAPGDGESGSLGGS